jgi:acyl-CoA synthetase (NDP forming)
MAALALTEQGATAAVLTPASIVVTGASENSNKVGDRPVDYRKRFGYTGAIYPVNPLLREVQGLRCYANMAALRQAPGLAIIAASGEAVERAVGECAARGGRTTIVLSSGFSKPVKTDGGSEPSAGLQPVRRGLGLEV